MSRLAESSTSPSSLVLQPLVVNLAEDCTSLEARQADLTRKLVDLIGRQQALDSQIAELERRRKLLEDEAILDAELAGKAGPFASMAKSSDGYAAQANQIRWHAAAPVRPLLDDLRRAAGSLATERAQLELDLKACHYSMRNRVAQLNALAAVAAGAASAADAGF